MPNAVVTADLTGSPEKVWAILSDTSRFPDWFTMHDTFVSRAPNELIRGAGFKHKVTLLGRGADVAWTVGRSNRPERLEMSGKGPLRMTLFTAFKLEPAGEGTRITWKIEFSGGILKGPLASAAEKESRKHLEDSLAKLRVLTT